MTVLENHSKTKSTNINFSYTTMACHFGLSDKTLKKKKKSESELHM